VKGDGLFPLASASGEEKGSLPPPDLQVKIGLRDKYSPPLVPISRSVRSAGIFFLRQLSEHRYVPCKRQRVPLDDGERDVSQVVSSLQKRKAHSFSFVLS